MARIQETKYLARIAFGPVQSFIAASRKLEDLCSGSALLDEVMDAAIELVRERGGKIIYPASVDTTFDINRPNIMLVEFPGDPGAWLRDLHLLLNDIFTNRIRSLLPRAIRDFPQVERQASTFLEIFWAYAQWEEETQTFRDCLVTVNERFAVAKRTRIFEQQQEPGPKCTLQTDLAVLAPPYTTEQWAIRKYWNPSSLPESIRRSLRPGERFSAIGLAKRLWRQRPDSPPPFPSTYSIASAMWRRRFMESAEFSSSGNVVSAFGREVQRSRNHPEFDISTAHSGAVPGLAGLADPHGFLGVEPQLLYETPLMKLVTTEADDPLAEFRAPLLDAARRSGLASPPKFFALLLADGDSMGRVFGSSSVSTDALESLSTELMQFCSQATLHVSSPEICGRMIYAGGDDLLAVVPAERALSVAAKWRESYRKALSTRQFREEDVEVDATISVAILLAPATFPLNRLLSDAHDLLEKQAKACTKDAVAVAVYKGNGENMSVVLPTTASNDWRLSDWAASAVRLMTSRDLSSKAMYDLRDSLAMISEMDDHEGIASRVAVARLKNNQSTNDEDQEAALEKLVTSFLDGMRLETRRRSRPGTVETRFVSPVLLAESLILLRNLEAMR